MHKTGLVKTPLKLHCTPCYQARNLHIVPPNTNPFLRDFQMTLFI